ncbi:hypothetical protein APA_242 [Pseudanabaena sp. lw0831]|nr:hypothetical protein APA_242 [Pseudanabaena sp. lw0831]
MLLCSEILQSMRQSDNEEKIFQGVTAKLLNLVQVGHVAIYQLDKFIDRHNGMGISGKIVAEAIAPNCEPCSQEQIENLLREEYQWGQDITRKIIDFYTAGVTRCEINLAEIFASKAYLLVPIVLSERVGDQPLWGFLILHQCVVLDGDSLQGAWDQDDVLMLQQIAMQIEIALQRVNRDRSLLEQLEEADHAYEVLYRWIQQYRSLVEQIPNVSYVSPINNSPEFAYISPQIQELLDVTPSEWNAGFFNVWADYVHPEDRDRVYQEVRHTIETGEHFCCEYRMINSQGKIIWVRDTAHLGLATDGKTQVLRGSAFDISDRKLTESKLLQNETLLKLTISNAPVGIATFDLQGKILTVNQGFCQTFGYPDQELLNMKVIELTHPNSVEKTLTAIHLLVNHEVTSVQVEKQYIHKHGHEIDVISRFGLVRDENGNPIQFVVVVEDVTDRKIVEAKLIAGQVAEAENRSKGEFLAIMSHELRTPMNAVIGMTEILQRTALSRQQQEYVNTIRQGGEVLLSVINSILDFSRIESGHFELEERPFRLHQCIEEVLELMASRTAEKFIELIPLISLDIPQQLLGDYPRLRQILVNLVSNAIKFTESGEIVITVNSLLIDRETNTYELQFEVRDTGIGIAPEAISRLFKAFSQADNSIARQYGGTGLGLAICKQLCELMGGEIGVSSKVGEGSTFSFSIRVQAIIEDLDATTAISPELKGKSILCVNTNSTLQQAIALYVQPWEITIQAAYTATDALQLLITSNFEAVLIDRQLVEADGSEIDVLELAKSIKEVFPNLILILLTPINVVINENTNSTYFRDCITKPISTSKLYQAFLNVFTNQKAITFSYPNPQLISQSSSEIDNILGDENFAKCYPLKILVVEDNPVNQKILLVMLENLGYQADAVENGQRAVNQFLSQSYDLIFMDIQMPIMNGLNATKTIRQIPNHQPWIIGLSANAFSESRDFALNAGMDDYLTKPLQTKSLIAALQRIPQHQLLFVDHSQPPIDLSTLASLEDSVGTENLDELINVYLEHSAYAIAKMKEAFTKQDFVAIEEENHVLKGGSGTFGAIRLCNSCQALQSICIKLIKSNEHTSEDVAKIAVLLKNIEEQYNYIYQIFQSREFNH